jgi:hypothetical protein
MTNKEVELQLGTIASSVRENSDIVEKLGESPTIARVFHAFKFAALCTKHPGFAEEREWRVVHTPELEPSKRLIKSVEIVKGIPQPVYKIPLGNVPDEGFVGAEVDELLERLIIGPTQYPFAQFEAFAQLLADAGVKDPEKRINISEIQLR